MPVRTTRAVPLTGADKMHIYVPRQMQRDKQARGWRQCLLQVQALVRSQFDLTR